MNNLRKEQQKTLTINSKFWCHFCQTNFQSKLKAGSDTIVCPFCHYDYCEIVTKNSNPELFQPFQKQPLKKQKYKHKIDPNIRKITINQLMQLLQIKQAEQFELTQAMVDNLRKKTIRASQCSVCRQQIPENEEALIPKCGHPFHQECVRQWIQRKNTCPSCRGQIVQVKQQND